MSNQYILNAVKFLLPTEAEEEIREQSSSKLATLGWSVPIKFSYLQINESAKREYTKDQVDEAIVFFYTDNSNTNLKSLVNEDILSAPDIAEWKDTIKECFQAFQDKLYLVVIPTLLTVIEGYLSHKVGTKDTTNIWMIRPTNSKVQEQGDLTLEKTLWLSISKIISQLYTRSDFSEDVPSDLNRHWIIHGRASSDTPFVDAVKLFNLLGSLSLLKKDGENN